MGFKANVDGLNGIYCKVVQVNLRNEHEKETLEDGTINDLPTYPLAVIVHTFTDETKKNRLKTHEHHVSYDINGSNPIEQAYEQIKTSYDIAEDNV